MSPLGKKGPFALSIEYKSFHSIEDCFSAVQDVLSLWETDRAEICKKKKTAEGCM